MASLAQQTELATWIDRSLDYLTREWRAIPEIASEWNVWDEADRLDFVLEWPLREDALRQLRQWDSEGRLTPAQRRRYEQLGELIQQHRATLERLLED
jgi:hypothetical protein